MLPPKKPKFAVKPVHKPRKKRTDGIHKESESVFDKGDEGQKIKCSKQNKTKSQTDKNVASALKVKVSDEVSKHLKCLASDMETHKSLLSQLESFVSKDCVTRREIVTLSDTVSAYTEINDIEVRVARTLKALYLVANVTEAQAENSSHLVKPSVVDNILETSSKILCFIRKT